MHSSARQRGGAVKLDTSWDHDYINGVGEPKEKPQKLLPQYIWLVVFLLHAILFYIIHLENKRLPEPKTIKNSQHGDFVEERAREHLISLTNMGERLVGTEANEVEAVEYLIKQLNMIKNKVNSVHKMDIDVQLVSGNFTLEFLGHFTSIYENVKNILVSLGPPVSTNTSLLVNCHYDSAIGSPGASDDAVSCSVMLEMLNVLAQQSEPLQNTLIFNFNGAEENILQASHGFITQHPWAKHIKAFVNLEAAGAGGRELVFQTGPEHPWLIQAYASSAVYPFASILGQEIFQSGVIPSDTDFRIYRDYGKVPGIDIAHISNGYVYHTRYDQPKFIPPGCMQRGGENLLATVRNILSSPYLAHPADYRHGNMVFFDVIGLFMIVYPERLGQVFNAITAFIIIYKIIMKSIKPSVGLSGSQYLKTLVKAVLCIIISWLASVVTVLVIAGFLTVCQVTMSWYTYNLNIVGLYVLPAVISMLALHRLFKDTVFKGIRNVWEIESVFFDASLTIWTVVLVAFTSLNVGSGFIALLWTLFPLLIRDGLMRIMKVDMKAKPTVFFLFHVCYLLYPTLQSMYALYALFEMFVPVLGRIGTEVIPDVAAAGMAVFAVISCSPFQLGLLYVTKNMRKLLYSLLALSVLNIMLVMTTPLGFPYSASSEQPSGQRTIIQQIERRFHGLSGDVVKQDSGIWYIPFDYTGSLSSWRAGIPMMETAIEAKCEGPYCGWPYYFPMLLLMKKTFYIPTPGLPKAIQKPELKLLDRLQVAGKQRLTFSVHDSTDHMAVLLQTMSDSRLVSWSLADKNPQRCFMPPEAENEHFFIFYGHGEKTKTKTWQFWIEVEAPSFSDAIISIAISSHQTHGQYRYPPEVKTFLAALPDWVEQTTLASFYEAWTF